MKKTNIITSSSNPLIKNIKMLHKRKERLEKQQFFIEGIRSIEQCISLNADIVCVVYSKELLSTDGKELLSEVEGNYVTQEISKSLFKEISDTDNPQGMLAVIRFNDYKLEHVLEEDNFIIILDRVQDPGNLGTIIRTADAFGANAIIVTSGCVDVYNPKTVRSSMGSILDMAIVHISDITEAIVLLKEKGLSIISSSLDATEYCYDIDFKTDCAIVIGNEANGISNSVLEISDKLVKIPMTGSAESLNAGVASAVLMYEVLRQRNTTCNFKTHVL